jgi:putative PEP-CTERM system TPR-repeat lipoprotein
MLQEAKKDIDTLQRFYKNHPQVHIQRGILQLATDKPRDALESAQIALKAQPEPPQANLLAGMALLGTDSPRQAEAAFSKYLSKDPNSPSGRRGLAQALIQLNESEKALAVLAPLLEASKPDAASYSLAAEANAKRGNFNEASRWYDKAATLLPNDSHFAARRAVLKFGSGHADQALHELAGAVEAAKAMTEADEILILGYLAQKRVDDASAAVESMDKRFPNDPVTKNLRGLVHVARGNKQAAAQAFESAQKLKPDFFPAASNLARLDLIDANPNAARKRYDVVLQANPTHLATLLAKAELEALYGNLRTSVELLQRAVKAHAKILQPKVMLTTAYVALDDMQSATALVEEVVALHPEDPIALVLAANVQMRAGNVNRTIQAMNRLVQLSPTPGTHLELARAQGWANRDSDAEASIRKALQLRGNFAPAQIALAGFLAERGRTQEALQFARSVQAAQPKSSIGFMLEGEIHERQKKWDEAIAAYRAALKREPMGFIASSLYRAQARGGNAKGGLAELEQWIDKHPNDRLSRLAAAVAHVEAGDFKSAAAGYEALLKKNARDADALNGLAWAYHKLNDQRALRFAEAGYSAAPLSPSAQDTLGWILVQNGDLARGRDLLKAAAKAAPDNLDIRFHLAVALHKSGDVAAAREELQALLATNSNFSSAADARALLASLK